MTKTIKTGDLLKVYNVLGNAKYSKMSDDDKIKVWKITRKLKPVATKFEEDSKDAAEKLKPTEDFTERLQKAQEYERMVRDKDSDLQKLPMGAAEYDQFIKEFKDYNEVVGKAIKEFSDKEVEVDFEPLSEDAFGKLMASNDWTMEQVTTAGDFVCE